MHLTLHSGCPSHRQNLHVEEVVGVLRAEALLLSGEAAKRVDAAADTLLEVHQSHQARLRDATAKVSKDKADAG